ncbi:hypothetical protein [Rhizobium sp. M10]|uniref:hypothetical protein n=1 Tax=Rhizobium sp. M10 TaxID=1324586 RepID=UPI001144D475|nr:hypothetical protein [Rhizobium sp. M10]
MATKDRLLIVTTHLAGAALPVAWKRPDNMLSQIIHLFIRRCHVDLALRGFHPQNTRITLDFGSVTDWTAVPLWTKFKRVGVSVATRSSLP